MWRSGCGQPIIIENLGGADGSIGAGRAARARPDGYTICLGIDTAFVLNGTFYSLPYDVLNDSVPISPLATGPIVLVARKTMPAEDLSVSAQAAGTGRFIWPSASDGVVKITVAQLGYLLEGIDWRIPQHRWHPQAADKPRDLPTHVADWARALS